MNQFLVTLGMLLLCIQESWGFDYCELTCNGTKHTLCAYPEGGGGTCLQNEQVYLTLDEKRWILELHNNFRQNLAAGKERRAIGERNLPPAGNMRKMVWDSEIAKIAKRWSVQCNAPHHDICRKAMDGKRVGQNVVIGEYKLTGSDTEWERSQRIKKFVLSWQDEIANFNPKLIGDYDPSLAGNTTSFTQMIWASTVFIGCGYTEFRLDHQKVKFRFICNYKPKGNIPYESIYRVGKPCGSCPPRDTCSETWDALCWDGTVNVFEEQQISTSFDIKSNTFLVFLPFFVCRYM